MIDPKYLDELIRTGIQDNEKRSEEFVNNFDTSACSYITEFNQTLLQSAISCKKYSIAKFLIKQKCNFNHQDDRGNTVLMYLLGGYNNDNNKLYDKLIHLVVNQGAMLDLTDIHGNQALWVGLLNAKIPLDILELLLKNGADMHHKNNVGKSPYDAVKEYDIEELNNLFQKYLTR